MVLRRPARLPLPSRISANSLVATRLLGSSATMRRISASAAPRVALRLADLVQHRQRAGAVRGEFQHIEAQASRRFRSRPAGAPGSPVPPAARDAASPPAAAPSVAAGCSNEPRAVRCRKDTEWIRVRSLFHVGSRMRRTDPASTGHTIRRSLRFIVPTHVSMNREATHRHVESGMLQRNRRDSFVENCGATACQPAPIDQIISTEFGAGADAMVAAAATSSTGPGRRSCPVASLTTITTLPSVTSAACTTSILPAGPT